MFASLNTLRIFCDGGHGPGPCGDRRFMKTASRRVAAKPVRFHRETALRHNVNSGVLGHDVGVGRFVTPVCICPGASL